MRVGLDGGTGLEVALPADGHVHDVAVAGQDELEARDAAVVDVGRRPRSMRLRRSGSKPWAVAAAVWSAGIGAL